MADASPDLADLVAATNGILQAFEPSVEAASNLEWQPSSGFLPVVRRAILRRQYDYLRAIVHMVEDDLGYAAVPLLRPACEELIWCKYLQQITSTQANRLLRVMAARELHDLLKAQDDYAGRTVTRQLNLLSHLEGALRSRNNVLDETADLGAEIGWDTKTLDRRALPSLRFVAKKTGLIELYNFLYHATSRFSHFSVGELLRRAWGTPGTISISSAPLSPYWSRFALRWGLELFLDTLGELQDHVLEDSSPELGLSDEEIERVLKQLQSTGKIPIITAEELKWPH